MASIDDIRARLATTHELDSGRGVYVARGASGFAYSDGAAEESYLAGVMRAARDLSVGSLELASHIRDWPSRYHLSPTRQNLLRPLGAALGGSVLEVGAGCGAITRQLGEAGGTVVAVEGSLERAAIAAARCRDLPNVVVVCDNFANFAAPVSFDLVTLIGVLEYSRMFMAGPDPVQAMLAKARGHLAEGGLLAIAIENQLGLKYLAGAREDHTGTAYFGVTDRYEPTGPVTFGEAELRRRVAGAGFSFAQSLYPFPDYKMPTVVVTEGGFRHAGFNATDLIATAMRRRDPNDGRMAFSEALALDAFVRNGLGGATANSFLLLAGGSESARARLPREDVLAFAYSGDRDRAYSKEARIVATSNGIRVTRRPLYPGATPLRPALRFRLEDEDYVQGEVLYRELQRLVARRGWSVADVAAWMRPLVDFFAREAGPPGELAPRYFDCTPFNVVRRAAGGGLVPFDLEWETPGGEPLTVARMVFRGLWNSLARVDDAAPPAPGTPTDVCTLALAAMAALGYPADEAQALAWIRGEHHFSGPATGIDDPGPDAIPRFRVGGSTGLEPVAPGAFKVQAYFHGEGEHYAEDRSVSVRTGASAGRIVARLALPARAVAYANVRLDPLDVPGAIRLVRVSVADAAGELAWESRPFTPADLRNPNQVKFLAEGARGTTINSEGIDPFFELCVPAAALARLAGGGEVVVEMERLDEDELAAATQAVR
jgi:precorrin-6B methylase 2